MAAPSTDPACRKDGTVLDLPGGRAWLIEDAIPAGETASLFARLNDETDWQSETIALFGRRMAVPRRVAWVGDAGYRYSGVDHPARPWQGVLADVRRRVERLAGTPFNGVLLNFYRDGADSMGWHADDEPELGPEPVIASLSLGAVRRFKLRRRDDRGVRLDVDLPDGSLLVMAGSTQRHWQHSLPKTRRAVGPRINLTFRTIIG